MNKEQTEKFINVVLGKSRAIRAKKPPTEEEKVVNKLVTFNRAVVAGMSQSQIRAAHLRGCC
jgi:hypothetical protein